MAPLPGETLLWTVDMLMDGVDFDSRSHSWDAIGQKCMAVNLSDCAAMGVRPVAALCAVALQDNLSTADALTLHDGIRTMGDAFDCPLVGGDTNSWRAPTVVSISVAARPAPGVPPVRRDGAKPGDAILLSGPVGGSILGRHLNVRPRVALGLELAGLRPHAMIDISDGVAIDLDRILEASGGLGAELDAAALEPLIHTDAHALARETGRRPIDHALSDGEDFELIVVLPNDAVPAGEGLSLRRIGTVRQAAGIELRWSDGRSEGVPPVGWEHLS